MPRPTPTRVRNHFCAGLKSRIARVRGVNCPCSARVCLGRHGSGEDGSGVGGHGSGAHYLGRAHFGRDYASRACVERGYQRHGHSVRRADSASGQHSSSDRRSAADHGSAWRCILPRCLRRSHQQLSSTPRVGALPSAAPALEAPPPKALPLEVLPLEALPLEALGQAPREIGATWRGTPASGAGYSGGLGAAPGADARCPRSRMADVSVAERAVRVCGSRPCCRS
jgi:hypothetical protein